MNSSMRNGIAEEKFYVTTTRQEQDNFIGGAGTINVLQEGSTAGGHQIVLFYHDGTKKGGYPLVQSGLSKVFAEAPLEGQGTSTDPLTINLKTLVEQIINNEELVNLLEGALDQLASEVFFEDKDFYADSVEAFLKDLASNPLKFLTIESPLVGDGSVENPLTVDPNAMVDVIADDSEASVNYQNRLSIHPIEFKIIGNELVIHQQNGGPTLKVSLTELADELDLIGDFYVTTNDPAEGQISFYDQNDNLITTTDLTTVVEGIVMRMGVLPHDIVGVNCQIDADGKWLGNLVKSNGDTIPWVDPDVWRQWVENNVSGGGDDTNNYPTSLTFSDMTWELTMPIGGTSTLTPLKANMSDIKTYIDTQISENTTPADGNDYLTAVEDDTTNKRLTFKVKNQADKTWSYDGLMFANEDIHLNSVTDDTEAQRVDYGRANDSSLSWDYSHLATKTYVDNSTPNTILPYVSTTGAVITNPIAEDEIVLSNQGAAIFKFGINEQTLGTALTASGYSDQIDIIADITFVFDIFHGANASNADNMSIVLGAAGVWTFGTAVPTWAGKLGTELTTAMKIHATKTYQAGDLTPNDFATLTITYLPVADGFITMRMPKIYINNVYIQGG